MSSLDIMLLGLFVALLMLAAGALSLLVARHAAPVQDGYVEEQDADHTGRVERIAARVHDGVGRTANAVDVLVDRRPADEVLRAPSAPEAQRTTWAVMGAGLLGLGAVLAVGVVLLLG